MKVAISACLLGCSCRYDETDNLNETLLKKLSDCELIPFCPEDDAFGTPRPTMDLIQSDHLIHAISNASGENLTPSIQRYAQKFFDTHPDIDLLIGKDRSPSCGVRTAKIYNLHKELISTKGEGIMVQEAQRRGIPTFGSEEYSTL